MFDSFVLGLFAPLIGGLSLFFIVYGIYEGLGIVTILAIFGLLAAAYMRYLSDHTQRIRD